MPQANSTTSWPRVTSPSASLRTLPCSSVMSAATFSLLALSSSRKAKRICVRLVSEASRHAGNAALATATASSRAAREAKSTFLVTWPVAGSKTSPVRSGVPVPELAVDPVRDACGHGRCFRWVGSRASLERSPWKVNMSLQMPASDLACRPCPWTWPSTGSQPGAAVLPARPAARGRHPRRPPATRRSHRHRDRAGRAPRPRPPDGPAGRSGTGQQGAARPPPRASAPRWSQAQVRRPLELTSLFDDLDSADHRADHARPRPAAVPADGHGRRGPRRAGRAPWSATSSACGLRLQRDQPLAIMHNWLPAGLMDLDADAAGVQRPLRPAAPLGRAPAHRAPAHRGPRRHPDRGGAARRARRVPRC